MYCRMPANELVKDVDKWKNTLTNVIDSQNAKLSEQVCVCVYVKLCVHVHMYTWVHVSMYLCKR